MEDSDQIVLDQIVDLELAERTGDEIVGSYRALCAMVLIRTATVAKKPARPRKGESAQKQEAQKWLRGGRGVISFESACEALEMDPGKARHCIDVYAGMVADDAINKRRHPSNRLVFGRPIHARSPDPVAEAQAGPGVGTCHPDGHRSRGRFPGTGPRARGHSSP